MIRGQTISLRNRQRARRINMRRLREVVLICLRELLEVESFEIGVQIIAAEKMARLNEQYLRHRGSTDVITFDYLDGDTEGARRRPVSSQGKAKAIHGDIYVCIDEAIAQARRFRSSWQEEIVRYIVHGILHLLGYDDRTAAKRAKMKREENSVMKSLDRKLLRRWLAEN